jgi:hypothetical protein
MPTKRTRRLRQRRAGNVASPALIAALSEDLELAQIVRLERRIGNEPFNKLTEQEGVALLHKLWPLHRKAAIARCIEWYGAAHRPTLWWLHDCPKPGRPFVRSRNMLQSGDSSRFEKERHAADLNLLQGRKLLSPEELSTLAGKNQKHFGPEDKDETSRTTYEFVTQVCSTLLGH